MALEELRRIKMADALGHLDCMPGDLDERIAKGGEALELAFSGEEPIQRAQRCLKHALERASARIRKSADSPRS